MNKDTVIKVENVSKKFTKSLKKSMLYGVKDIGRNMLGLSSYPDRLRPDDYYNAVLIIMQRQQVSKILPILQKNQKVPSFIFIGNNVNGAEEYLKFLE